MVRLFVLFLFFSACAPVLPFECDEEAKRIYPHSEITVIDTPVEQIYIIDGKDAVRCSTEDVNEGPYLKKVDWRPWKTAACDHITWSYTNPQIKQKRIGCPAEKE
jgi:hypothetical protein